MYRRHNPERRPRNVSRFLFLFGYPPVVHHLHSLMEWGLITDLWFRFLWVDWQLRDLCKYVRESDIHTRLGKLPNGLTGVYNEIMTGIKSQPECNFRLATNALKWMLVSKRPLKPGELVAAAEIDPQRSISVHNSPVLSRQAKASQESTLTVEALIQCCEGLLLLDTGLGVVRFSHLSVQEYLETRNEIWNVNVIDAQIFVSESCLWTLQSSLELPLYKYAAENWFQHCRSYQDLALAARNLTKHDLNIPLLNTFLGSFNQASDSYMRWADNMSRNGNYDLRTSILSTPLCPAFSAAFAGLGELVSWLWHAEGDDLNIKNGRGHTLLQVASGCEPSGRLEIVTLLLDRGADVNATGGKYGTALVAAASNGKLEIVTLLLDRGADVNATGGEYGTALGAAAIGGGLQTAKLLLDRGADPRLTNSKGERPHDLAEQKGHQDIMDLLNFEFVQRTRNVSPDKVCSIGSGKDSTLIVAP